MSLLESRVKETEVTKNMSVLSKQLSELQRQLKMKTESIASLEKELNEGLEGNDIEDGPTLTPFF